MRGAACRELVQLGRLEARKDDLVVRDEDRRYVPVHALCTYRVLGAKTRCAVCSCLPRLRSEGARVHVDAAHQVGVLVRIVQPVKLLAWSVGWPWWRP